MGKFIEIQIYCSANKCCFEDIRKSKKPTIVINTDCVSSLSEKQDWGFCDRYWAYPYRKLTMNNGDSYLVPLEEGDKIKQTLLCL